MGTVNIVAVPSFGQLAKYTRRVLLNNGLIGSHSSPEVGPILSHGRLGSSPIKHVIFINKENATHDFINKENATHDLLLGDITQTRKGVPVNGDPNYSLGF